MAEVKKTEDVETPVESAPEAPEEVTVEATSEEPSEAPDKAKEWEDKYLRLFAEFDNFKKRSAREKDARYADALIDAVAELLPVLDNLDRALAVEVTSEEANSLKAGVEMVKLEVTEIPAVGEQFDPNVHNAVMHIEDETIDDNTVVEEFMKGYIYKDLRVVRHSMVKVAN